MRKTQSSGRLDASADAAIIKRKSNEYASELLIGFRDLARQEFGTLASMMISEGRG